MTTFLKLILACILCILAVVILYVLYVILYPAMTEFKPDEKKILLDEQKNMDVLPLHQTFSILSWNIGYAGLGSDMDFFYEGGKKVRPSPGENKKYLDGISDLLKNKNNIEFILLQEVDFNSKRSYKTDQFRLLSKVLHKHFPVSATNYKSAYVPSPAFEPMGKVDAGQATFSKYNYSGAQRISTPGSYSWPMRLYMLKRCFLITQLSVENGQTLVIFNIHNSAFDDASDLRIKELALLKEMALEEYKNGNYVLIGGDWNQNPPDWELPVSKYNLKSLWPIQKDFMPENWIWGYDSSLPTNRDVDEPFNLKSTTCTLLDYYLASPNIHIVEVKTVDLGFENSDHLPVKLSFELR